MLRVSRSWLITAAGLIAATAAVAQEATPPQQRYQQTPAVLALYPPLSVPLTTPALKPGRTTYTSQAELEAFIGDLTRAAPSAQHISTLTLGTTPGGHALLALLLTKEGATTPGDVAKLNRPIVWLIGQQHGNEPAGSEAMLALAKAFADGELTPLLDTLSVVIIPRANPDGAAADTRENASGNDINRDHGLLTQPEIRMIHDLVRQLPPAVVIDAHEFTVGRRWVTKLGGLQSVDLMVLSATHPMVPEPLRQLADTVFQPAIEKAIAPHKLTSFVYHTTSSRAGDRSISVGGNAPGIARNMFGLMGAVSFLLETRGVGIGLDSYQRRVATHYIAAKAVLQSAAANVGVLATAVAQVRATAAQSTQDIIVAQTVAKASITLPLIDPVTALDKSTTVEMLDTRIIMGTETRARPAGYLVPAERARALLARLVLMGARVCTIGRAIDVPVERYEVVSRSEADRRAINPDRSVQVRLSAGQMAVPTGSLFIPLDQPAGTRLALALEPDAPGSLAALDLLAEGETAPAISRVPAAAATAAFVNALTCPKP